ncbi:multiheme c-type cytochrome [Halobacteriovorax sp. HLS]|uniref:multiheme c-type cytochrome n=1 Tax=Halobacteriovorax sp. HLS TaxID=2234000 RepID=UPI0019D44162|nr:multiheme c-type cytochrome [Halobacteriovorax sp. HLS]
MKRIFYFVAVMLLTLQVQASGKLDKLSNKSKKCMECHQKTSPAIVEMWGASKHFRGKVGCYECHQAQATDKDQFMHHGERISIIVSPKDCSKCHSHEVKEFSESHHAQAAKILGSLDNVLAEVVEGNSGFVTPAFPEGNSAAAVNGCWQCHGSEVKVLKGGKLDPATWPNTGIGRLNPDGSRGSCSACHSRHKFSVEQARNPENCGKCHMGPDHPQMEIYKESKHGIAYYANKDKMNMDNGKWIPGQDYNAAPTCATCHMSATKDMPVTHDVGLRISWNNRPAVSIRPEVSDKKLGLPGQHINWKTRRKNMKNVCLSCHNGSYVDNFYTQYDALVELYNEKFAKPGLKLMAAAQPLLNPVKFSNELDFIWFEIWHHEGRRARHGAAMMGPDYTHWHGTYEVAKHFYAKLIPKLKKLAKEAMADSDAKVQKDGKNLKKVIDEVLNQENHKWFLGKMSDKERAKRKKNAEDFKKRYEK